MKIFHIKISKEYIDELRAADMNPAHVCMEHIRVRSTKWFDLKLPTGRLDVARHIAAIDSWADAMATRADAS